ncbi:MAG: helix-turn-helix transcriptional regulator [Firmicutes bacterium]|nr:helix-turn-helix transcriptional regulator [Bacillota bacterium]
MIKENIDWKEDLPVKALVADVKEWPLHFHKDMEIIYVLEGSITLKSGGYVYKLSNGDVFIVNSNEIHSIEGGAENNMVMCAHINRDYFMRYYPELENRAFFIGAKVQHSAETEILRESINRCMLEIMEKGRHYKEKVVETAHNTVAHMLSSFSYALAEDEQQEKGGSKILTRRLARIMNYICGNYNRKLTLQEIAEHEDLSIYYLSHIIKEYTTMSFQDFLNYLRAYESVALLKNTNKKVSVISEEMGFSAVRYYIKHFEISYGITPQEYRSRYKEGTLQSCVMGRGYTYSRSAPENIKRVLKSYADDAGSEMFFSDTKEPVIIEADISTASAATEKENLFPGRLFGTETMKLLARPYNIIKSFREKVLGSGINYIVSAAQTDTGEAESVSILVYNLNEEICGELRRASFDKAAILKCLENVEINTDFLVKLTGLKGDYTVNRYKMSRENTITTYEDAINKQNFIGRRQMILNNWRTFPSIDSRRISVKTTLNIISRLSGFSAELILIDRAENAE